MESALNAPVEIRAAALIAAAQLVASGKLTINSNELATLAQVATDIVKAGEDKVWRKGESDFLSNQ
jgi:hypothetical protein